MSMEDLPSLLSNSTKEKCSCTIDGLGHNDVENAKILTTKIWDREIDIYLPLKTNIFTRTI